MTPAGLVVVAVVAFLAALLSSVAGFGGGVVLLPVFVAILGTRQAVAVLTVTQIVSNVSRVWFNRAEIRRGLVGLFAIGAVPAAVAGALVLTRAPVSALTRVVGVFLLVLVVWRRLRPSGVRVGDRAFVAVGVASGFGSALVGSVGPLVAPFFLARGLAGAAYIGTEAASAVVMHATKLVVFGAVAVLTVRTALLGLALAPATIAGAWLGRRVVDRLPAPVFVALVEAGLVASGVVLIVSG